MHSRILLAKKLFKCWSQKALCGQSGPLTSRYLFGSVCPAGLLLFLLFVFFFNSYHMRGGQK